jgi:hypothetical protein
MGMSEPAVAVAHTWRWRQCKCQCGCGLLNWTIERVALLAAEQVPAEAEPCPTFAPSSSPSVALKSLNKLLVSYSTPPTTHRMTGTGP